MTNIDVAIACCTKEKDKRHRWMKECGYSNENLLKEIKISEPEDHRNYMQMDSVAFDDILKIVAPIISKKGNCDAGMHPCKYAVISNTTLSGHRQHIGRPEIQ